jgi:hypothetical protein
MKEHAIKSIRKLTPVWKSQLAFGVESCEFPTADEIRRTELKGKNYRPLKVYTNKLDKNKVIDLIKIEYNLRLPKTMENEWY